MTILKGSTIKSTIIGVSTIIGLTSAIVAVALLAGSCSSGSSSGTTTQTCPPCGANMVCDETTGTCVTAQVTCNPACGPNANCSATGSCTCVQGYSDCNLLLVDGCECATTTCNADGTCGGTTPDPDSGPGPDPDQGPGPTDCNTAGCPLDKVCSDSGECVDKPTPAPSDIMAMLQLRRLIQDGEAKTLGDHGEGAQQNIWFRQQEALPPDNRQIFQTTEGETCTYEAGMSLYLDGWPSTPRLGAGDVTFTVTGAPGPIIVGANDSGGEWYYWRDEPGNLPSGSGSIGNWFEPEYLPFGATFTAAAVGGPDLGAMNFSGQIPNDFTIISPREEADGKLPKGDLTVKWDPPQPGAKMEIVIGTADMSGYMAELSCLVADDGETTLPAAATGKFVLKVLLEMRRSIDIYSKIQEPLNNLTVHATVNGRVEHHRWISFEI